MHLPEKKRFPKTLRSVYKRTFTNYFRRLETLCAFDSGVLPKPLLLPEPATIATSVYWGALKFNPR
jgi:hypothetical protein